MSDRAIFTEQMRASARKSILESPNRLNTSRSGAVVQEESEDGGGEMDTSGEHSFNRELRMLKMKRKVKKMNNLLTNEEADPPEVP